MSAQSDSSSCPSSRLSRFQATLALLFVAFVWGTSFIAMKTAFTATLDGRPAIGVMTLLGLRFLLGGVAVLPFARLEGRKWSDRRLTPGMFGLFCLLGVLLSVASFFQQLGVSQTTVTHAGFLTSLYVPMVPLIVFIFLRQKVRPVVWLAVAGCVLGSCFLTGVIPRGLTDLNQGDGWVIFSTVFWALHVIGLGLLASKTGRPVLLAAVQFLVAGILGCVGGLVFEAPFIDGIVSVWPQIVYAGLLSVGVAYTLQGVAQRAVSAPTTAIILSMEMVFAALAGALILHERLVWSQWIGAGLILSCLLLVEVAAAHRSRRARVASV